MTELYVKSLTSNSNYFSLKILGDLGYHSSFSCFSINKIKIFIESIGVPLVHKIIQVSSVQLNKTSPAHCIVFPSPQENSLYILIPLPCVHLHLHSPPFPVAITTLLSVSVCVYIFFLLNPFTFFHPVS